ncbi:hypothetical protein H7I94_16170 [Mycobacterium szulgai]|nr:hypothetical protein [Mycobacterium szulgai]
MGTPAPVVPALRPVLPVPAGTAEPVVGSAPVGPAVPGGGGARSAVPGVRADSAGSSHTAATAARAVAVSSRVVPAAPVVTPVVHWAAVASAVPAAFRRRAPPGLGGRRR